MTTAKAKEEERESFDKMVRLLGLELDGEPQQRERPDFVLRLGDGRTVGVELVRARVESIAAGSGVRQRISEQLKTRPSTSTQM